MKKILLAGLVLLFCNCSKDSDTTTTTEYYLGQMVTNKNVNYGKIRYIYEKDKWIILERIYIKSENKTYIGIDKNYFDFNDTLRFGNRNPYFEPNFFGPNINVNSKKNANTINGIFLDKSTGDKGSFICTKMSEYDSMQ